MRDRQRRKRGNDGPNFAAQAIDLTKPEDAKYAQAVITLSKNRSNTSWDWYSKLGEIHYGVSRSAKVGGYAELGAYKVDANGDIGDKVTSGLAGDIAATLYSPYGGSRGLIERFLTLMKIPADSYLVEVLNNGQPDGFDFVSADELKIVDPTSLAHAAPGTMLSRITLPATTRWNDAALEERLSPAEFVGRVWRPSARFVDLPDSPLEALDSLCEMLYLLSIGLRGKLLSRLASNGIIYIPSEVNEARSAAPTGEPGEFHQNKVINELLKAAHYAARNPTAPEAAIPIFMVGPGAQSEQFRHIVMDQELYATDMALRTELIQRIMTGLDVQPAQVQGSQDSNHWCCSIATEIMALSRGWITQDQLEIGDLVLTINHDTGQSEWQPVTDIYRADVVDEPMLSMESASHSSLTTAGHRWPIVKRGKFAGSPRRWTTSGEGFAQGDQVPAAARVVLPSSEIKYTDDFVRLVAAYTSDGTIQAGRPRNDKTTLKYVRIAKFDPDEIDEVRRILRAVFGDDGWREGPHPTRTVNGTAFGLNAAPSQALFDVTHGKKVVSLGFIDDLTAGQLDVFLQAMLDVGDGIARDDGMQFFQVEPERLDPIEYAAILAGWKTTRGVRNQQTGFGDTPLSWLRISKSRLTFGPIGCEQEWVPYTGLVWCPTTKNHTWLARHRGKVFFTGNSGWLASEDELRVAVRPDLETMCWALTRLVLWKKMQDAGQKPGAIAKHVIWYDMSKATSHQNAAEDARQSFDRGIIGPEATRRYAGHEERDAPTPIEYIRMVGMKLQDPYLATYGMSEADKFDWDKISGGKSGPSPDSQAPEPPAQPGKGQPGSPDDNKSKTPARLRPAG